MIHLVTLNPALDFRFRLEDPAYGKIGKVAQADVSAGGKALNVSRFLTRLGVRSTTWLGTGGGEHPTHVLYRALLKSENLQARFLSQDVPIRFNLVMDAKGHSRKYNHPGFKTDLPSLPVLSKAVKPGDFLVLTGRLPEGMK